MAKDGVRRVTKLMFTLGEFRRNIGRPLEKAHHLADAHLTNELIKEKPELEEYFAPAGIVKVNKAKMKGWIKRAGLVSGVKVPEYDGYVDPYPVLIENYGIPPLSGTDRYVVTIPIGRLYEVNAQMEALRQDWLARGGWKTGEPDPWSDAARWKYWNEKPMGKIIRTGNRKGKKATHFVEKVVDKNKDYIEEIFMKELRQEFIKQMKRANL